MRVRMGTCSEGVGALVMRRGDADGAGMLVVCGSAVRQDGRSASLTAPNGSAQRILLFAALGRAAIAPREMARAEAHGTGTALGDPTEAGALGAVHRGRTSALALCAAKASVGHAEASSGQVGVLRVVQCLESTVTSGNAQLRALNPLVGELLGVVSCALGVHGMATTADVDLGGVSSLASAARSRT